MRLRPVFCLFACLAAWAAPAADLALIDRGASAYRIVLPPDAVPAERTAAAELRHFLKEAGGVELPIGEERGGKNIFVGRHVDLADALGVDFAALKPDEIILRALPDGDLALTGDRPRGSLYAVYEFLETALGVTFWTSWETEVPARDVVTVPADLAHRYAPVFPVRYMLMSDSEDHPEFRARLRFNCGSFRTLPPELGGNILVHGFCHTFGYFVPAKKYFADHPEYFSLIDGKRNPKQLCLTNPDMRRILGDAVMADLDKNPAIEAVSVSINDGGGRCECAVCAASDARYGGVPAGTLLEVVNEVARRVAAGHPRVMVETISYGLYRAAPTNIKAEPNVSVRLCTDGVFKSLSEKFLKEQFEGWSNIAGNLSIWNYTINWRNHLIPYPTLREIPADLKFFAKHSIWNVFQQGEYETKGRIGDLAALRTWLTAKLLWDPSRDGEALIRRFLDGYYGEAAAPHILAYIDLMENGMTDPRPAEFRKAYLFLSLDAIDKARAELDLALAATADDPVRHFRVRTAKMAPDFAWLDYLPYMDKKTVDPAEVRALVDDLIAAAEARDAGNFREGKGFTFARYAEQMRGFATAAAAPLPSKLRATRPGRYIDLQNVFFTIEAPGGEIVSDPAASGGVATYFDGKETNWYYQADVPPFGSFRHRKWRVYVSARADGDAEADVLTVGVYDVPNRKAALAYRTFTAKELHGKKYKLIDLGAAEFGPLSYLFIAPAKNPEAGGVYFDRVILIAEP